MAESFANSLKNLAVLGASVKCFTDVENDLNSVGKCIDAIVSTDESDANSFRTEIFNMRSKLANLHASVIDMVQLIDDYCESEGENIHNE